MHDDIARGPLPALFDAFSRQDSLSHGRLLARAIRTQDGSLSRALLEHPLGDEWLDFAQQSLSCWQAQDRGHLYVVTNPVTPAFLKVGKTRLAPAQRLKRLNNEAVVGAFILVQAWAVHDRHYLEAAVHRSLNEFPRHKEFFVSTWDVLCPRVSAVIDDDRARFERHGFPLPDHDHPHHAA